MAPWSRAISPSTTRGSAPLGSAAIARCRTRLAQGDPDAAWALCRPFTESDDVDKIAAIGMLFGEAKQYAFRIEPKTLVGRDALIVGQRNRTIGLRRALTPYFDSIDELPPFAFGRSGMNEVEVRLLYGHVLKKPLPSRYERP